MLDAKLSQFRITPHLTGMPSLTAQWFDRVSPKWRVEIDAGEDCPEGTVLRYLKPEGYMEILLLSSDLFCNVPETDIRDIRPQSAHGRRYYRCRDRRLLSEALAKAIIDYLRQVIVPEVIPNSVLFHLENLKPLVEGFVTLRRQKLIENQSLRAIHPQEVLDAYSLLQRVAREMSFAEYAKIRAGEESTSSAYASLLSKMDEAFLAHGPVRYPAEAVDYAKALILRSLQVERNVELKTIVSKYRQNRRRARII